MRIICETKEEMKQAKTMVIRHLCNRVPDNDCNKYNGCYECIENNSIYIELNE